MRKLLDVLEELNECGIYYELISEHEQIRIGIKWLEDYIVVDAIEHVHANNVSYLDMEQVKELAISIEVRQKQFLNVDDGDKSEMLIKRVQDQLEMNYSNQNCLDQAIEITTDARLLEDFATKYFTKDEQEFYNI